MEEDQWSHHRSAALKRPIDIKTQHRGPGVTPVRATWPHRRTRRPQRPPSPLQRPRPQPSPPTALRRPSPITKDRRPIITPDQQINNRSRWYDFRLSFLCLFVHFIDTMWSRRKTGSKNTGRRSGSDRFFLIAASISIIEIKQPVSSQ